MSFFFFGSCPSLLPVNEKKKKNKIETFTEDLIHNPRICFPNVPAPLSHSNTSTQAYTFNNDWRRRRRKKNGFDHIGFLCNFIKSVLLLNVHFKTLSLWNFGDSFVAVNIFTNKFNIFDYKKQNMRISKYTRQYFGGTCSLFVFFFFSKLKKKKETLSEFFILYINRINLLHLVTWFLVPLKAQEIYFTMHRILLAKHQPSHLRYREFRIGII